MAATEKDVVLDEDLSEVFDDDEVIEEVNEAEKPRSRLPIYVIGGIVAVCGSRFELVALFKAVCRHRRRFYRRQYYDCQSENLGARR